jgi:hypothetical protein
METSRRTAGLGLALYGLATVVAFTGIGAPGGNYEEDKVVAFMSSDHWRAAAALGYLGAVGAIGLLVFAVWMRPRLGDRGDLFWALAVAGSAAAVIGWFLVAGMSVAFGEGGSGAAAAPHSAVYLVSEMSNLVTVCASAFFLGAATIVIASRETMSAPLRIVSYGAGVCGVFAAFFFPLFLFWLWVLGFGVRTALSDSAPAPAPHPQLA